MTYVLTKQEMANPGENLGCFDITQATRSEIVCTSDEMGGCIDDMREDLISATDGCEDVDLHVEHNKLYFGMVEGQVVWGYEITER